MNFVKPLMRMEHFIAEVAKLWPAKAFYPARGPLFVIAKQMYSAVFRSQSHFDLINLNAKSISFDG